MENKKLRLEKSRFVVTFLLTGIVIEILVIGGYFTLGFIGKIIDFSWILFGVLGAIIAIMMVVFAILGYKSAHYEVSKKGIIYYRGSKKEEYKFEKILYIDEVATKKHHVIEFYDDMGTSQSIVWDENHTILDIMKKYCDNLITKEEYKRKFPQARM